MCPIFNRPPQPPPHIIYRVRFLQASRRSSRYVCFTSWGNSFTSLENASVCQGGPSRSSVSHHGGRASDPWATWRHRKLPVELTFFFPHEIFCSKQNPNSMKRDNEMAKSAQGSLKMPRDTLILHVIQLQIVIHVKNIRVRGKYKQIREL